MFNTIITTVKTLLRRPSTWVWGALFPIALSTMFMFMFANLSSVFFMHAAYWKR